MSEESAVQISEIGVSIMLVPVRGTAPLLVHRFSQKAKKAILWKQQGLKLPTEPRDPEAEYEASIYHIKGSDQHGFPAVGFKAATVSAARFFGKDVTMTSLRQSILVTGVPGEDGQSLIPIEGTPAMREDVVRIGNRQTDLRYRAQYDEWSAVLPVTYVTSALTKDSVLSLIDAGGMGVGVGEWRPEKGGDFGRFHVDITKDIEVKQ